MRVLVYGGRDFIDEARLNRVLDRFHVSNRITVLIEGGARGADRMARSWARRNKIMVETYNAEWDRYGSSAGPRRNRRMRDEGKPDAAIAFPGGTGTANMTKLLREIGMEPFEG